MGFSSQEWQHISGKAGVPGLEGLGHTTVGRIIIHSLNHHHTSCQSPMELSGISAVSAGPTETLVGGLSGGRLGMASRVRQQLAAPVCPHSS